jgi:lipopolysaccharide export system protein LptC
MELRNSGAVILLAAAALVSTAVFIASDSTPAPAAPQAPPGIGYYATNARLMATRGDGKPAYDMRAERITQTLADGSIGLEHVVVNYAPEGGSPWNLVSDAGRISTGADIIELNGNVVAASADQGKPATAIRTDFLRYDPATGVAETQRPVTIEYASSVVHARGLRADLREGRLALLAEVRGQYIP